ncbi:MAG: hypothetical protein FLDDKLPJ_03057 [Phycisphaerae bacterium]|nr:hypothetical protein [Phycisphaerae bacterium]
MEAQSTPPSGGTASELGRKMLRLHLTKDVGPIRTQRLLDHFGSVDAVLAASPGELERVEGVGRRVAAAVRAAREDASAEQEIAEAARGGARILCRYDPDYPWLLRRISDPPTCVYVRGTVQVEDALGVAIVGARKCSHYGVEQARRFAEGLARAGLTIVSGMARGIDGAAHLGALAAGGRTLAVLGNGLKHVYPPEHKDLADRIVAQGALISELPMDTAPDAHHFPPRNRIIVGLTLGVLIVEASERSGALITARLAADYNREVFAIPGRVDQGEYSAGVNRLIRDGSAQLVTTVEDVLDGLEEVGRVLKKELDLEGPKADGAPTPAPPAALPWSRLSEDEARILAAVAGEGASVEAIHAQAGLDPGRTLALLTSLQLKGAIRALPGNRFAPREGLAGEA